VCVFVYSIKHLYVKFVKMYVVVAVVGQVPVLSFPVLSDRHCALELPKVGGHLVAALFNVYRNFNFFPIKCIRVFLYGFRNK
jgi:hypothetical protein